MTGNLPSWMGQDKERKRVNKRSQRYERALATEVGGKPQPGSGSSHRAPQDVVGKEHLIQHKFTKNKSYRVDAEEWRRIRADAIRNGREPLLVVDMDVDGEPQRLFIQEENPCGGSHDMELAWAAGLFAGEGCTTLARQYVQVTIGMYDEASILRWRNALEPYAGERKFGGSSVFGFNITTPNSATGHTVYRISTTGKPAVNVCVAMLPFLAGTEKEIQMKRVFKKAGVAWPN